MAWIFFIDFMTLNKNKSNTTAEDFFIQDSMCVENHFKMSGFFP